MRETARYRVEHETTYVHREQASTSQHVACLTPRTLPRQRVLFHELLVHPAPSTLSRRTDYFGNEVSCFSVLTPYQEFRVTARSLVEVHAPEPADPGNSPAWEDVRDAAARGAVSVDVAQFCYASPSVDLEGDFQAFAAEAFTPGRPFLAAAIALMHQIHRECRFDPGATTITTPVSRVLADRHGVCQDFAHLQIACLRSFGLAARYVSGYLLTDPPEGQPRLIGADASHAWVSVWCPRSGWVDLDPTNDVLPEERHVTIGWGRDYTDVSPLRGVVLGGGHHTLHVGVSVVPEPAQISG